VNFRLAVAYLQFFRSACQPWFTKLHLHFLPSAFFVLAFFSLPIATMRPNNCGTFSWYRASLQMLNYASHWDDGADVCSTPDGTSPRNWANPQRLTVANLYVKHGVTPMDRNEMSVQYVTVISLAVEVFVDCSACLQLYTCTWHENLRYWHPVFTVNNTYISM